MPRASADAVRGPSRAVGGSAVAGPWAKPAQAVPRLLQDVAHRWLVVKRSAQPRDSLRDRRGAALPWRADYRSEAWAGAHITCTLAATEVGRLRAVRVGLCARRALLGA